MPKIKLLIVIIFLSLTWAAEISYLETFASANLYEETKNYPLAIQFYKKTIELEPRFAGGYNGLGFVYLEQAQYESARAELNKALALQPNHILALMNVGASYYRENDYKLATEYFQKILKLDPKNVRAYTNLAIIRYRQKDYWGAWDYYQKAKRLDEEYLKQRYNKEKSLKEIEKLRQENPKDPRIKALEERIRNEEIFLP